MMPPLIPLHPDESLIQSKLDGLAKESTDDLIESLKPGTKDSLKVRPDGTVVDGNHRVKILRDRGAIVDDLPREIVTREEIP